MVSSFCDFRLDSLKQPSDGVPVHLAEAFLYPPLQLGDVFQLPSHPCTLSSSAKAKHPPLVTAGVPMVDLLPSARSECCTSGG